MNVLDLFSGIGGFSLGLERAGMRTVAFCEIKPFARRVLADRWPAVPCYPDVRELTADRPRADGIAADVICGGFPCQDISSAGTGAGIDGARSGLWSEYARLIGELRPQYVVVENVAALLGRGLSRVLGDLAALGYDAEWDCVPASAVGARHRRDRIWIVAYPNGLRRMECTLRQDWDIGAAQSQSGVCRSHVADAERGRLQGRHVKRAWAPAIIPAAVSWHCRGGEFGEAWRIEPDVGRMAYGIPDGMDRIEGLGNAVVPQIPEIIGREIMNIELQTWLSEKITAAEANAVESAAIASNSYGTGYDRGFADALKEVRAYSVASQQGNTP